jgi:hypothetical protein
VRYEHEFLSFAQDRDGVSVLIRKSDGETLTIRGAYLVGCDGGGSSVRKQLGITLRGEGNILHFRQSLFRCDGLFGRIPIGPGPGKGRHYHVADDKATFLIMQDSTRHFTLHSVVERDEDMKTMFERTVPVPVKYEMLYCGPWKQNLLLADSFMQDRVFLAGDAVHLVIPTGGLGMNTGVGEATDLAWKLAAVLQGWGGPNLLASYHAERQPVGLRNVGIATDMYHNNENFCGMVADLERDDAETEALRKQVGAELERVVGREFRTIGAQLGYRYEASPICVPDGTLAPADPMETYVPTARPGSRAPHAWLTDGRSTLDLSGRGFVLLCFAETADTSGLHQAAAKRGVPLSEVSIDDPVVASLYQRTLALVRPDGHVAWRADVLPSDAGRIMDQVTGWT